MQRIINDIISGDTIGYIFFGELTKKNTNLHSTGFMSPEINKQDLKINLLDLIGIEQITKNINIVNIEDAKSSATTRTIQ